MVVVPALPVYGNVAVKPWFPENPGHEVVDLTSA